MKKNIFTILLLMLFVTTVTSQSEQPQSKKINVGITIAPAIDWISIKNADIKKAAL